MTRVRSVLGAAALAAALVAAVAAADAHALGRDAVEKVEKASVGTWSATLRLRLSGGDRVRSVRGARLLVRRSGTTVLDRAIALPGDCADDGCVLPDSTGYRTLELRRLGGPAPVAILWLWTGGAHCCSVVQAVDLPSGRFVSRNFGNSGTAIRTVDDEPLFVARDERFPYRYTSYAASGSPVQLFRLDGTSFVDVTAEHPSAVRADSAEWWKAYLRGRSGGWELRGVFAAWAADACRLGRRDKVEARLAEGVSRGWFSPPRAEDFGPVGSAYATVLMADLAELGYCAKA